LVVSETGLNELKQNNGFITEKPTLYAANITNDLIIQVKF
jgi:hypothetical protein